MQQLQLKRYANTKQFDFLDFLVVISLILQIYSILENDKMEKKIDKLLLTRKGENNAL